MNFIDAYIENNNFEINGGIFTTTLNRNGKIIVGIRAEKMTEGDINIFVKPEIIEMTGSERIAYFKLNGNTCSARLPLEYKIEENLNLKLSVNNMYFFDINTGDIITNEKKL